MNSASLALDIEQGATFSKTLTWKTGTPPSPVDLTGCRARMQVRERIGATQALLTLTTENGGIVLGGTGGQVTLNITAAQTDQLTGSVAVYSVRIIFTDGTVKRLVAGAVRISPDATHD